MSDCCLKYLDVGTGPEARRIALRVRDGVGPGLFWLGGFKSDMQGTKAVALDRWAQAQGRACIRFDYSGHGESGGRFADGSIGRWLEECVAAFEAEARGPQVVVGSSMGGWLALLLVRELRRVPAGSSRAGSVAGLVLVAPAVDFTEELMWKRFPAEAKRAIERDGATVLIDSTSLVYLLGSEIDFVDDLIGAQFRISNPNATASCGCGTSFSI